MFGKGLQQGQGAASPVSFGQKLATSDAFRALFREGMTLVEETAGYLDGPGREESKGLARAEALAYASESMRLTTRLMQIASWLLLQRAVNEGELTRAQAASEKHKVKLSRQELASGPDMFMRLPERMQELATQSLRLQARVLHLDQLLYADVFPVAGATQPVAIQHQIDQLRRAFTPTNH